MIRANKNKTSKFNIFSDLAPDMTPMLDIIFILLVFLMLASGAVFQSLDLKLPTNKTKSLPILEKKKQIILEISESQYALNGVKFNNFIALKVAIEEQISDLQNKQVIIAADKNIALEKMLEILTYLKSKGVEAADILMNSNNQNKR